MTLFAAVYGGRSSQTPVRPLDREDNLAPPGPGEHRSPGVSLWQAPRTFDLEPAPRGPSTIDGIRWIVANARLDNRTDLHRRVRAPGHSQSTSAHELLLRAYERYGHRCVEHLTGDFCFVVWDADEQTLFAARDRFGVHPLFIARSEPGWVLTNSLSAAVRCPGVDRSINLRSIADYVLVSHVTNFTDTEFEGVSRVPPAHTVTLRTGQVSVARYWSPPTRSRRDPRPITPNERIEEFATALRHSVARRRGPRTVVDLTGGMDTSSIAAFAAVDGVDGLTAHTARVTDPYFPDESVLASMTARYLGLRHAVFEGPCQGLAVEPRVALSSTTGSGPMSTSWAVSAATAPVRLSGLGGDVALSAAGRTDRSSLGDLITHTRVFGLASASSLAWRRRPSPMLGRSRSVGQFPLPPWLRSEAAGELDVEETLRREATTRSAAQHALSSSPYWAAVLELSDPAATGFAVQPRYPFLDGDLYALLLRTPPHPWLVNKAIARLATRGLLPEAVRTRRKAVLAHDTTPEHRYARHHGPPPWVDELTTGSPIGALLDERALRTTLLRPARTSHIGYRQAMVAGQLVVWSRAVGTGQRWQTA